MLIYYCMKSKEQPVWVLFFVSREAGVRNFLTEDLLLIVALII